MISKNNFTVFVSLLFLVISASAFGQKIIKESEEIEVNGKYPNIDYIGSDDKFFYSYKAVTSGGGINLRLFKMSTSDLSLVAGKEIDINAKPYLFKNCLINCYYANGHVLAFYSFIDTKGSDTDYRIFLKIFDSDLNEVASREIALVDNINFNLPGAYEVVFSPDKKMALLVSKKSSLNIYREVYEKAEFTWLNTTTGEKLYSKFMPVENETARIKTYDYCMDNDGNVANMMMYFNIKEHTQTLGAFISYNKIKQEKMAVSEIDLKQRDSSISAGLAQLSNGNVIFYAKTAARTMYKFINMSTGSLTVDQQYPLGKQEVNFVDLDYVLKAENGYYLVAGARSNWGYSVFHIEVIKVDEQGKILWAKLIPKMVSDGDYYNVREDRYFYDYKLIQKDRSLEFITLENADFPATPEGGTMTTTGQKFVDAKLIVNSDVVCYAIDESGKISRKVLYENKSSLGIVPYSGNIALPDGSLIMNLCSPKKIKFVKMKLD